MTILVTGAAGFIGMHVAKALLDRGERVLGIDNLNAYYDPALKRARLAELEGRNGFTFEKLDFAERSLVDDLASRHPDIDRIVHLGAQAGVRWSIENPFDYLHSNLAGQLVIMELARRLADSAGGLAKLVYASSSSVYGENREMPLSLGQVTDRPMSFYGATKKSNELMAHSYAHLYRTPTVGLRFFTVYGPWGRPDMSPWIFTSKILAGDPIQVFDHGRMRRDFTFIDDIAAGVVAALDLAIPDDGETPHRVYNLGNHRPVGLMEYIQVIAKACGRTPVMEMKPRQPGDVTETFADIEASRRDLGFAPETPIEIGIPRFVEWYRRYHGI